MALRRAQRRHRALAGLVSSLEAPRNKRTRARRGWSWAGEAGQELLQAALALPVTLAIVLFGIEAGRAGNARLHAEAAVSEICERAAELTYDDLASRDAEGLEAGVMGVVADVLGRTEQPGVTFSVCEDDLAVSIATERSCTLPSAGGGAVAASCDESSISVRVRAEVTPVFGGLPTETLISMLLGGDGQGGASGRPTITSALVTCHGTLREGVGA